MPAPTGLEKSRGAAPYLEALLCAAAGGIVIVATWYFFGNRLRSPDTAWYAWIRPLLLAGGGTLCLVAAALIAARRPSGRDVLQLAVGVIPLVFAVGLVTLPFRFVGEVMGWIGGDATLPTVGGLLDRLWSSPQRLAINLALIAAVVLLGILGRAGKSSATQREQRDKA